MQPHLMLITLLCLLASNSFAIRLVNNSYVDVVIAINRDLKEDVSLIQTIKDLLTDASPVLYRATRKRAYFKEVTIVVPDTWNDRSDYLPASARETFSQAKVRINPPEIIGGIESNSAFVESTAVCGLPGLYMHITPKRMTDPRWRNASPPHKMFVHEWGHLRWGFYDEYYQGFYGPDFDGRPARCVEKIATTRSATGTWRFSTNGVSGSIMWKQYYDDVVEFCDDSNNAKVKHYRMANNAQNRFCDLRSSWEVMRETDDFRNGKNPPREINSLDLKPTFRVVRKKTPADAVVLVLDVSNSMFLGNRLIDLRQATKTYINEIKEGSSVAIVHFNDAATIKQNLTKVTGQKSRDKLSTAIPTFNDLDGQTSIGGAILKAVTALQDVNDAQKKLLIISDGTETTGPKILDERVQQSIESAKVTIHTISIGEAADDNLSSLSEKTGGMAFFHDEVSEEPSVPLEAVGQLTESDSSEDNRLYQVNRQMMTINARSSKTAIVDFDDSIGRDTLFYFFWSSETFNSKKLKLSVTSPAQKVYKYRGVKGPIYCNIEYQMCELRVAGEVKPGEWTIIVNNRDKQPLSMTWEVFSHQPANSDSPLTLNTYISRSIVTYPQTVTITASLMKGKRPVIDAMVSAVVTRPAEQPVTIHLYDNGAGPDLMKYDGLYSVTFTQFSGAGRYNVKVIASQDYTNNRNFNYSSEDLVTMITEKQARLGARYIFDDLPPEGSGINLPEPPEPPKFTNDTVLPRFTRVQSLGMFTVKGNWSSEDAIPPSQIMDLRGRAMSEYGMELTWTAPGDDMESGQASAYSIRVSTSFDDLVDNFYRQREFMPPNLLSSDFSVDAPRMAGLTEKVMLSSPVKAEMVFVAMKTRDKNDQWSGLSNVVYFNFIESTTRSCSCPVRPSLEKAVCKHNFVIVGTVDTINKDNILQFRRGAEFLKPKFAFVSVFSEVKLDINRKNTNGCLCPIMPVAGGQYVMSGMIRGRLEVTNQSYLQPAPADMAQLKRRVDDIMRGC